MKTISTALFLFSFLLCRSQTYQWAKAIGAAVTGNLPNNARAITTDGAGNVYMTGNFKGTNVDFNPGQSPVYLSSGTADIFISKHNASGTCIWSKGIIGSNGTGQSVKVDFAGNIYVTGNFLGTNIDFDPGPGTALLNASGVDIFIAKYDNNGNYVWAKSIGGSNSDIVVSLCLEPTGNIYVTGRFQSTNADFDPGPAVATLSTTGNFDIFLAKYDNNGNYLWAESMGGVSSDLANEVSTDAVGNAFITGYINSVVADFDPSPGTATLSAPPMGASIFFAKYNNSGAYQWAKAIQVATNASGNSIDTDASGNSWITGYFQGQNVDFDPGPGTATLSAGAASAKFFARYDAAGNYILAKSFPDAIAYSIKKTSQGKILVFGGFAGTVDFDPGPGTATLSANGNGDLYFAKYDGNGNYIWAKSIDTPNNVYTNCIVSDASENVLICGNFFGNNVDFDPGPGTATLSAPAYYMYLAKYGYCSVPANNPQTICSGGSYAINNHTYTTAGLYNDTLYTKFGCDSLVLTQLTLSGQQPSINIVSAVPLCTGINNTLTATGAQTYTWSTGAQGPGISVTPTLLAQFSVAGTNSAGCTASITVNAMPVPILSITAQQLICKGQMVTMTVSGANSFTWGSGAQTPVITVGPTINTVYSVTGTNAGGCNAQKSITITVNPCLGTNSNGSSQSMFKIYPNPATNEVFYTLDRNCKHSYKLTDFSGTLLVEAEQTGQSFRIDLSAYPPGFYFLTITIGKSSQTTRFVKE